MDCLKNYIGIQGCGSEVPESGEYINRLLPGIPLESIDKIAQADQVTYAEVWKDVQNRAAKRFQNDVIRELQKRYRLKIIQQSTDLLSFINTVDNQSTADDRWRGFTVELAPAHSQHRVYSSMQCIYVQSVRLYRKAVTAAIDGKIFDLDTGEVLSTFTIPVNTVSGWTTVNIAQRFFASRIFIAFDSTDVDTVEQDIATDALTSFNSCACDCFCYDGCYTNIRGAQSFTLGDTITDDGIDAGSNTFGLSGVFSVQCSYAGLICQNKETFLYPWALLLGAEFMWERVSTSRINRWTIGIGKEDAKTIFGEFESRYAKEIETVLSGIDLNLGDCCLECNAPVTYSESML